MKTKTAAFLCRAGQTIYSIGRNLLPMSILGVVWVLSYFAYNVMQNVYRDYCSPNLFHAVLFSQSDACVYLSTAIRCVENVSSRVVYVVITAFVYHVYRTPSFSSSFLRCEQQKGRSKSGEKTIVDSLAAATAHGLYNGRTDAKATDVHRRRITSLLECMGRPPE